MVDWVFSRESIDGVRFSRGRLRQVVLLLLLHLLVLSVEARQRIITAHPTGSLMSLTSEHAAFLCFFAFLLVCLVVLSTS